MPLPQTRAVAGAALAVVLVACGATPGGDVLVEQRMATDDASPTTTSTTAPTASTTAPTTASPRPEGRLSIDDALMDEGDIDPPWQLQHRNLERQGYGAGPNQTDCEPYWRYEQRHDLTGGTALWWRDGGNVNHEVFRAENAAAAADFLAAMRMLPESCPVTSWSEGDSFRIEAVDLGDDGIVGLEFVDAFPDERHHVAISVRGELISVVWVVQWPPFAGGGGEFPHASTADLGGWAERARERLDKAGDAAPTVASTSPTTKITTVAPTGQFATTTSTTMTPTGQFATTTSTTMTPTGQDSTTVPANTSPSGQTPPTTAPGTRPTTTVPPPPDPTGVARYLLTDADLADLPGWTVGPPTTFDDRGADSTLYDGCAARDAIDELGRTFAFEAVLDNDAGPLSWQYIGEQADDDAAADLVADFATLADCEFEAVPIPVTISGGALAVPNTSAAAVLEFSFDDADVPESMFRLVVLASGPRVTALAFTTTALDGPEPGEIDRIVEIAAFKLTD